MRPTPALAAVRRITSSLPRSYEVLVRDRVKFRVGDIVYLAFSPDERRLGFAFPREERAALIDSEPSKFLYPSQADLRFNWLIVDLAEIDLEELTDIVLSAWEMVVPKKVAAAQAALVGSAGTHPPGSRLGRP